MWKIIKKMARYDDEHLGITKFSSSVECDKICLISDVNWQWGQRVCSIKWEGQTKLYLILNTVGNPQGIYGLFSIYEASFSLFSTYQMNPHHIWIFK